MTAPAKTNAARRRAERAAPQFRVQMLHQGGMGLAPAWCGVGPVFRTEHEAKAEMARRLAADAAGNWLCYEYRVAAV